LHERDQLVNPLRLQDFKPGIRPKRLDYDAVQWLIDERERERSGKKYGL